MNEEHKAPNSNQDVSQILIADNLELNLVPEAPSAQNQQILEFHRIRITNHFRFTRKTDPNKPVEGFEDGSYVFECQIRGKIKQ